VAGIFIATPEEKPVAVAKDDVYLSNQWFNFLYLDSTWI
jgi:hypothetical protein